MTNPDLLWGLRGGGGGNFGVVTSFEYRLCPVGPQVIAGGMVHSFADAAEVFRFFADFVASAPDELSVMASTFPAPATLPVPPEAHGKLVTMLAVCYAGDLDAGARVPRPLRSFGRPLADLIAPMPYTSLQTGSDGAYPSGRHNYWKSHVTWAREFSDAMPPHSTGVYVNNLGTEGTDRVRAAYAPETYKRLVALKQTYDPHNVFRLNQNIPPGRD